MFCIKCIVPMKHVLRFMDGKNYEFFRCPNCNYESKAIPYYLPKEISQKTSCKTTKKKRGKPKNVQRIYNYHTGNS